MDGVEGSWLLFWGFLLLFMFDWLGFFFVLFFSQMLVSDGKPLSFLTAKTGR